MPLSYHYTCIYRFCDGGKQISTICGLNKLSVLVSYFLLPCNYIIIINFLSQLAWLGGSNSPAVYGLDATRPEEWDQNVLEPAARILEAVMQVGKRFTQKIERETK